MLLLLLSCVVVVCCCCARLILLVPKIVVFTLNPSCSEDTSRSQEFNSSVVNCLGEWVPTAMPSAELLPQRIDCWLWHKIGTDSTINRLNKQPDGMARWHFMVVSHGSVQDSHGQCWLVVGCFVVLLFVRALLLLDRPV